MIPPPSTYGLPARYDKWRPYQSEGVEFALRSDKRFIGINAPTGFGKTVMAMVAAQFLRGRACYVTANKGLQDSIRDLFGDLVSDIRGKANYPCQLLVERGERGGCDRGPCNDGVQCSLRFGGCGYFDAQKAAQLHDHPLTNYSKWLTIRDPQEDGIGEIDTLILDEAHEAFNQLSSALRISLSDDEWVARFTGRPLPKLDSMTAAEWASWAAPLVAILKPRYDSMNALARIRGDVSSADRKELYHLRLLVAALEELQQIDSGWVVHPLDSGLPVREEFSLSPAVQSRGVAFTPIWPARYRERLFRGVKRVVLMSATIMPDDLQLLGIGPEESDFVQYPSSFPARRAPFIWVRTLRMKEPLSDHQNAIWVRQCDRALDARADRKTIIHTGSYRRQRFFLERTRHRSRCLYNDPRSRNPELRTAAVWDRFVEAPMGTVLVGPAYEEGWDAAYEIAESQIAVKIPFLDTRDPVNAARCKEDKTFSARHAMKKLMQLAGRPMRADDDSGETLLFDDQWDLFFLRNNAQYAAGWFLERTGKAERLPAPPPKLTPRPRTGTVKSS